MRERGSSVEESLGSLLRAGLLPRDAFEVAAARVGSSRAWRLWIDRILLIFGAGLAVAGVIFFVAYNWAAMGKFAKLGGMQALVVACLGAAFFCGLPTVAGRVLLFCGCVFVGVYFAVFGQIYQSGADAWELFRAWALLITLFVIASRDGAHWLLLLLIVDLAIASYWEVVGLRRLDDVSWVWPLLAATQALWLAGCEVADRRSRYFVSSARWTRWVLVPAILCCLASSATMILIDDRYDRPGAWATLLGLVGAVIGGYRYFRHVAKDIFCLSCLGFTVVYVATVLAIRGIARHGDCGSAFFIGLLLVGMLTTLVRWIRHLGAEMQREGNRDG